MGLLYSKEQVSSSNGLSEIEKRSETDKAESKKAVPVPLHTVDQKGGVVH